MSLNSLTLLRPNMGNYRARDALPPLAMAVLAARTPQNVAVRFYDDRIEEIPEDDAPDLVAISVETFSASRAYQLARNYRRRNIPVVMGGYHPSLLPDEALQHADAVVIGDAENSWERLLDDFRLGSLKKIYSGGNEYDLQDTVYDRSIFQGKKYPLIEPVQYGRGCPYHCEFCSIFDFYKGKVRYRPLDNVVNEIKQLDKRKLFFFVDDNLYSSKESFLNLLEAIKPLNIAWFCQVSIDVAKDDRLLDLLASSGCLMVLIGFESLSKDNLRQMGKEWNLASGTYETVVKKFHSRGIAVYGTFVFGYDQDTPEIISKSLDLALKARFDIVNFNPLTPTPGSMLYQRLHKDGRLISPQWWVDPNFHYGDPIFTPKSMDATALARQCYSAKKRFYAWGPILRRVLFPGARFRFSRSYMIGYANIVSRIEIKRKQSRLLGD